MSSKIQTVQQCYAEFGKGNPQGVLDLLHEDVLWIDPGYPEIPYAGKRRGKAEVLQFFGEMSQTVQFTQFEPRNFWNDGDMVVVKGYFAGKALPTGKSFESEWVMLWEVKDGKVKYYQAFVDTHSVAGAIKPALVNS
jgi:ketosteroid isomerase-like protein